MYVIFTGPSGSGKTSIIRYLVKNYNLLLSVSYTTRQKREGEVDGIDYFFISKQEFSNKIDNNELEEYTYFNGNFYGTPKNDIENLILDLEYEGVTYFHYNKKDCILIYIDVDIQILVDRLVSRGTDEQELRNRMDKYSKYEELKKIIPFDFIVDNNGEFNSSVKILVDFLKNKNIIYCL
ncbi:hypothetical protein NCER_101104 [Vairimorpha ceranae BRL01]|uniref:Guanylate kinase-like domain-containing protein n=2 Tax=Vairimorpha ceranae TaxID=40302 RepID=C4V988_VAIC1|nr:guanylate kinase [Vairimorpha ceranae]EEQ82218.1 hypothetical protein NCER_101104 [Vairimorpha ceranae BRL01]KAF5140425.1 hypothetical protein G9O61_00g014410 [Vairimorpha ceranae]KAF5141060.1 hypothetical protein G9O61_00g007510 [Vairimorpha ceranae]KKO75217.1 guanylate kinase [Vairimorpha ceranae]